MIDKLFVSIDTELREVLSIMENSEKFGFPKGIALVVNQNKELIGTITDGDVRRNILNNSIGSLRAEKIMNQNPITFEEDLTIIEILSQIPQKLKKRNRANKKLLSKVVLVNKNNQPVRILDYYELWEQRVANHRHLVVIGMGYVGLTMAAVLADAGYNVTGVEVDKKKIESLNNGNCYIHENGLQELLNKHIGKNFKVTNEYPEYGDVYIISVGTPTEVNENNEIEPVMKYLDEACTNISRTLKRGNLVVLRSTVPIGTCRNFVKEKIEKNSGLKCGIDFHLSFAPERTAEGKALKELRSLPQIIGGYNQDSTEATVAIFRDITPTIIRVESLEAAEMVKLINNTFRDYIFAYSNQMARIANKYNMHIVDIINAANEGYPRDPVPLPSPGVGGPCLTKDPYIFASVSRKLGIENGDNIFKDGRTINISMHSHVYDLILDELKRLGKTSKENRILVCGLAFKGEPETGDIRNSSSIEISEIFIKNGFKVFGYDAIASKEEILSCNISPVDIPEGFKDIDVVLFLNNHKSFEKINIPEMLNNMSEKPIIFDGWNLFRHEDIISHKESSYIGLSHVKSSIQ